MLTPILVIDKETGDVAYFESLKTAKAHIEPYDVDLYSVYDADARIINVLLDEPPETFWSVGPGEVQLQVSEQSDANGLQSSLLGYLRSLCKHPKFVHTLGENPELRRDDSPVNSLIEILKAVQRPG